MIIKQISIFIENQKGALSDVLGILKAANINIRALSLADTTDFGILRLIVDQPEEAIKTLKEKHITVALTEVVAIEVPDNAGGLSGAVKILSDADISIEYMYAFVGTITSNAIVIMKFSDIQKAIECLSANNVKVVLSKDIYK